MKVIVSGTRRFNFIAEIELDSESLNDAANAVMDMSIYDMSEFITQMDDDREGYMSIEVIQDGEISDHFIVVDEDGDFIEEGCPREDQ